MSLDPWTAAAILGMAAVTYACRAGGYWLFRQITPGPMLRAVLSYIPGTLFVSFVVPALLAGRAHTAVGTVATLAAAAWLAWSLA